MDKKGFTFNIVDLIAGIIIIAGGGLIVANYVNLGTFLTALGAVFEGTKIVLTQGLK